MPAEGEVFTSPFCRFLLASGCNPDKVAAMTAATDERRTDYPRVFIR